jgi:ElaB/YqjD/DUF883 family membrane-anchored ribosome-binding protein
MENKIESGMNDLKGQMNGKASAFTDQAKRKAKEMGEEIGHSLTDQYEAAKKYTTEAYDTSVEQVKNNPMISLGAALAVGAVAGYLLARRK